MDVKFNVIGLSETWFSDSTVDLYNIPGYNCSHVYRKNRRGGGVSVYIKETINFQPRKDLNVLDPILECVFVEINKINVNCDKNIIVGVYIVPLEQMFRNLQINLIFCSIK